MSVKVRASEIIEHPVVKVFCFHAVEHVRNHPRWDPDIQLARVTDGPVGVGTMIKRINSRSGSTVEGTMEVIEIEPDRAVTMLIHDGSVKMIVRATYEAEGDDRTLHTMDIEFPDLDDIDTNILVSGMQKSIRNINQLLRSEV